MIILFRPLKIDNIIAAIAQIVTVLYHRFMSLFSGQKNRGIIG